jgi:O-antigen/teichoic acid export membrane protein
MHIRALGGSTALRGAIGFALGGGGFALANLLLARSLPPEEYGLIVLFIAVTQLGATLGPAGMDTMTVRHRLTATPQLLSRVGLTGTLLGGGAALCLHTLFDVKVDGMLAALLIVGVLFASANKVGCSFLLSLGRVRRSISMLLTCNVALMLGAGIIILSGREDMEIVAATIVACYGVSAMYGWFVGYRDLRSESSASVPGLRREAFCVTMSQASTAVLNQLDRILIPRVASAAALGEYAAATTLCGSPFNVLQSATLHTLTPKLRNCPNTRAVLHTLRTEAVAALTWASLAAVAAVVVAPRLGQWLFKGRYDFELDLVQLIIGLGALKIWQGFAAATIQALGSRRSLFMQSIASWIALAVAAIGVLVFAERELTSVVSAIGVGWLSLCIASTVIAGQAILRLPEHVDDEYAVPQPVSDINSRG